VIGRVLKTRLTQGFYTWHKVFKAQKEEVRKNNEKIAAARARRKQRYTYSLQAYEKTYIFRES
jgi:hypothetical protein